MQLSLKNSFGTLSFYKKVLFIAIPVIAQQLIMSLASLVDNFMVSGLGDAKMGAVNVANQVNFVYFVVLWTLCGAGGIFMSQYFGAKDEKGMQQVLRFKLIVAILFSSFYVILTSCFPEFLLGLMVNNNVDKVEIIAYGSEYMRIVTYTWIPIGISIAIGTAFREIGKVGQTLFISLIATIINTVLNFLLIYGNFGFPKLEIAGAAIATVVARVIECILFVAFINYKKPPFFVHIKEIFHVNFVIFKNIITRSALMVESEFSWVMTETISTALYNGRGGSEVLAGLSAGWTLANLTFLVFPSIHTSVGVIVGTELGKSNFDDARKKAKWLTSGFFVAGIFVSLIALSITGLIPFIYSNLSISAQEIAKQLLYTISFYLPLWMVLNAQFAISRSGGDTLMGAIIDIGFNLLLFIPLAFILANYTALGPIAMLFYLKLTDFPKYVIAYIWLKKEYWIRNLTGIAKTEAV